MNNFEFKRDLNFVKRLNPFLDLERLKQIASDYLLHPARLETVYDGNDFELRAALLMNNQISVIVDGAGMRNTLELSDFLPALEVIAESNTPICLLPVVAFNGRAFNSNTQKMRTPIPFDKETFKAEFDNMIRMGLEHEPPYGIGVYTLNVTPIIYNPNNFEPMRGLLIRYIKYLLNE